MALKLTIISQKQLEPIVPWEDITCILLHNQLLFTSVTTYLSATTTGCNGKINVWDKNLNALGEFKAHEFGVYHLCKGPDDTFYSCAADSLICHWKIAVSDSKQVECTKLSTLKGHLEPPWKLQFFEGKLYSADELGEIRKWENDQYKGVMETYEEIWDMVVISGFIFTVRCLDVTVTATPEGTRKACSVANTIPGKGPLFVSGDKLFLVHRRSNDIVVHSINELGNPLLKILEGHTALINSFVGCETVLFSGDYEGKLIAWDLQNLTKLAEIVLSENGCINCMSYDGLEKALYVAQEKKLLTKIMLTKA